MNESSLGSWARNRHAIIDSMPQTPAPLSFTDERDAEQISCPEAAWPQLAVIAAETRTKGAGGENLPKVSCGGAYL